MSVQGDFAAVTVNLAYPAGDMLLLALLLGALALTGWRPDRAITLLGIGVVLTGVADLSYLNAVAHGSYDAPTWASSLWPASALVTAIAAWQPLVTVRPMQLAGRRLLVLPVAAMTAALGLLFYDHFHRVHDLGAVLAFATLVVAGVRLWLTLSEHMAMLGTSRGEATTDPLTGLGNRRALANDLDEHVIDASPQRPLLLLLFDLNGFKSYNDMYGHPAGDALLVRLGSALARTVDGHGHAYRMGGDEFCVLTAAPQDQHADIAALTRAALTEHGDGFEISAALGSAVLDAPDGDRHDALREADRRMYAEKNGRRVSAGGQSAAVLLRVLSERHPDLGDHVDGVVALTERVGIELGMVAEDRTALWHAAALHDIGKAAVPDAILNKPGPLDEEEWTFMRRHTVIGERILAGAPALAAASQLVRSSHEWFDGTGYPDALAGAEIPLGARIVAVCDAYDAMVSDRPYRSGMASELAVEELARCAGTQFDPAVVDAFIIALARPSTHKIDAITV
jgi:diguanylate cyclase (GGDEF)-like protein